MFWQIFGTALGITMGLIIAGGWIFLQYRRDQMHYKLLTVALDRGLPALPGRVPAWIRSMWQGVLIMLLGVGVLAAGVLLQAESGSVGRSPVLADHSPPPVVRPPATGRAEGVVQPPPPPAPPGNPPGPDMPRLERMERLRLIGLINMCAGGVLILLGIARMGFARLERRYIDEAMGSTKVAE